MRTAAKWQVAALAGGALLAGTFIGPPVVHAATAGLVTIQGSGSTNQAAVTKAGQLEATEASATAAVSVTGFADCNAKGFYVVPAGKALIITGVLFFNHLQTAGHVSAQDLLEGPSANPCDNLVTAGLSDEDTTQNQTFRPGIAVPAGDALGGSDANDTGTFQVTGYLVPKAAVPAATQQVLPRFRPGQALTITQHH